MNNQRCLANPFLPLDEYIADGEPRVFGDRVYLYGSHDLYGGEYCSHELRVYSAPLTDLSKWTDHGVSFSTYKDKSDVPWSNEVLYAPDVIEKDGIYYLYFCLADGSEGVATSLSPAGPFSNAKRMYYPKSIKDGAPLSNIDPAAFVDDDGSVYYYWGQFNLQAAKLKDNMFEIEEDTYNPSLINESNEYFHEGSSMRKIGDTYYLIYCSTVTGRANNLDYATAKSPLGPFERQGTIINNYDADPQSWNNHGSIQLINDQWYIFYHKSSNNSVASRRACVEPINIDSKGRIAQVEMTSNGFGNVLNAYSKIEAAYACQVYGGCYAKEYSAIQHGITRITNNCFVSYKYLDFGSYTSDNTLQFRIKVGNTAKGKIEIRIDDAQGEVIGIIDMDSAEKKNSWFLLSTAVKNVTGKHSLYLSFADGLYNTNICDIEYFQFFRINS